MSIHDYPGPATRKPFDDVSPAVQLGGGLEDVVLDRWRDWPAAMVEELWDATPDKWQREGLDVFPHVQRLAFKACKGPGKTCEEAWLIINFLLTRLKSKVNATSITGDNLFSALWPELGKWIDASPLLQTVFEHTATAVRHRRFPRIWYATARTWPKKADSQSQADALAGLHADYAMWVLDESGGIPESVLVAVEAVLASGIECKVVQGGNPTSLVGALHRACYQDAHLWHVITITGDPDDPMRSPRISLQWAKDEIAKYGRDNPWVMVNVLGQFPPASINSLLSEADIDRAMARTLRRSDFQHYQKRIGIDVARFGDDKSVLFPRQGPMVYPPKLMRNVDTVAIAAAAANMERNFLKLIPRRGERVLILVDDTGHWGHGVYDILNNGPHTVVPVIYSDKALSPRYYNRRAEFYLEMADAIKRFWRLPKGVPNLAKQLLYQTYTYKDGKMILQPKEMIKELVGESPDEVDALAQTCALPDQPVDVDELEEILHGGGRGAGRGRARTSDDAEDDR